MSLAGPYLRRGSPVHRTPAWPCHFIKDHPLAKNLFGLWPGFAVPRVHPGRFDNSGPFWITPELVFPHRHDNYARGQIGSGSTPGSSSQYGPQFLPHGVGFRHNISGAFTVSRLTTTTATGEGWVNAIAGNPKTGEFGLHTSDPQGTIHMQYMGWANGTGLIDICSDGPGNSFIYDRNWQANAGQINGIGFGVTAYDAPKCGDDMYNWWTISFGKASGKDCFINDNGHIINLGARGAVSFNGTRMILGNQIRGGFYLVAVWADRRLEISESYDLMDPGNPWPLFEEYGKVFYWDLGFTEASTLFTVTDTGTGTDAAPTITADVPVAETGVGTDANPDIEVVLSAADTGTGTDADPTIAASVPQTDVGAGSDADPTIAAAVPVAETGTGTDAVSQILAELIVADGGTGADVANALILISALDTGTGTDADPTITAAVPVAETGTGTDDIAQILASLLVGETGAGSDDVSVGTGETKSVADTGAGTDATPTIVVTATVTETGTGAETTPITVDLSVSDTGLGTDAVAALLLTLISDTGTGSDDVTIPTVHILMPETGTGAPAVLTVAAQGQVTDAGAGADQDPGITVDLTVAEVATGADIVTVMAAVMKTVTDLGAGTDEIFDITVQVPLADSGVGTTNIANIAALLTVLESASATDSVVAFDESTRIVSITFSMSSRSMAFSGKKRTITFKLN